MRNEEAERKCYRLQLGEAAQGTQCLQGLWPFPESLRKFCCPLWLGTQQGLNQCFQNTCRQ